MNEKDIPPIKYVDLDGTLAYHDVWLGVGEIGSPIPRMVDKVKRWLSQGVKVVVFTARLSCDSRFNPTGDREKVVRAVKEWCRIHIGQELEVSNDKGFCHLMYDDRAVSILRNTGLSSEEICLRLIADMRGTTTDSDVLDRLVKYLERAVEIQ